MIEKNQMEYIREEHVVLALRNALGNIDIACKDLGVTRAMFIDYMANHPDVAQVKRDLKEAMLDLAEQQLELRMLASDPLLMFYLRTQGKERGYGTSSALTGPNGGPIQVNVNARALIAAMRDGFNGVDSADTESTQNIQNSDLHQLSDLQSNGD